ncbi:MAG: prepilin-type N-terminal cleavage/methylation domain-containing protein [Gemmatimonadales bacterium]
MRFWRPWCTALPVRRHDVRRGFTVLEVLLALVVGGITIALAHRILVLVVTGAEVVVEARRSRDLEYNGRRWLRSALGSITAPGDRAPFIGRHDELWFTAATRRGEGWFAPERLGVGVLGGQLVVDRETAGAMVLADSIEAVAIEYLHVPGLDARWGRSWISATTAPIAVRFRILRGRGTRRVDTLVYLIKDRR